MVGIVDVRRVTVHRSGLVELLGLITCVRTGLGQVAKFLEARAEVCLTRAFGSGKARQDDADKNVGNGLEVTVKEQQGWRVRHETEKTRRKETTCACNKPFSQP